MQSLLANSKTPAIISLLLVIPFMIMELVNRPDSITNFPIPLFGIMWILPVLFILTGMPILRNVQAGNSLLAYPVNLLIRVAFLFFIAWFWGALLIDQMPCFLGVPNCD
jgi:cation transport ATPase